MTYEMSLLQFAVDVDQEVDGPPPPAIDAVEIAGQPRRERRGVQERLQIATLGRLVREREVFGGRLEEEVERIVDGHLGDEVDLDPELVRPFPGTSAARRSCSADPAAS